MAQSAIQYLAQGESLTQTYAVQVADNSGGTATQDVTITITGTNEAPVITSSVQSGTVTDAGALTASGAVTYSDVDTSNTHTASFTAGASGYLGTFSLDSTNIDTGNGGTVGWNFSVAQSAIQYLAQGESLTQTYAVQVADNSGGTATQDVTITITGTNEAPVITSSVQSGTVTDAGALTASGAVTYSDVDTSNTHTASFTAGTRATWARSAWTAPTLTPATAARWAGTSRWPSRRSSTSPRARA